MYAMMMMCNNVTNKHCASRPEKQQIKHAVQIARKPGRAPHVQEVARWNDRPVEIEEDRKERGELRVMPLLE